MASGPGWVGPGWAGAAWHCQGSEGGTDPGPGAHLGWNWGLPGDGLVWGWGDWSLAGETDLGLGRLVWVRGWTALGLGMDWSGTGETGVGLWRLVWDWGDQSGTGDRLV